MKLKRPTGAEACEKHRRAPLQPFVGRGGIEKTLRGAVFKKPEKKEKKMKIKNQFGFFLKCSTKP